MLVVVVVLLLVLFLLVVVAVAAMAAVGVTEEMDVAAAVGVGIVLIVSEEDTQDIGSLRGKQTTTTLRRGDFALGCFFVATSINRLDRCMCGGGV